MEKSHVSMEQKLCPVTGVTWDSGAILLDKRMKQSMERYTTTGMEICPEVKERIKEGFIPMVEADPKKSETLPNGNMNPKGAYRTGRVFYLKVEAFKRMFNAPVPKQEFCYVDIETGNYLEELQTKLKSESDGKET
jgi:hypothetical protein